MSAEAQLVSDSPAAPRRSATAAGSNAAIDGAPSGLPIELRAVSKAFGRREVLKGLDLTIAPGEFVAVVGRSGGGKSTLLRLLAGLEQPSGGVVAIDGAPVAGPHAAARMMFQDARLLPWQTVIGNVGIARGPDWRRGALEALTSVGLAVGRAAATRRARTRDRRPSERSLAR
jgi:sulfonate transport system ATP-binding protein